MACLSHALRQKVESILAGQAGQDVVNDVADDGVLASGVVAREVDQLLSRQRLADVEGAIGCVIDDRPQEKDELAGDLGLQTFAQDVLGQLGVIHLEADQQLRGDVALQACLD